MVKPNVLVLTGYGINCDEEKKYSFEVAGAKADIVHINDLIANKKMFDDYQVFTFPGGFSYGDDTGSGNALANKIRNHVWDEMKEFVSKDKLVLGVCNGFQVMVNLGLLPATNGDYGKREVALMHNESARYVDRWVDLKLSGNSPWVKDIDTISVPIAHGEGNFFAEPEVLKLLHNNNQIAAKYVAGEICEYQSLPANPNGSLESIAGITDETGRLFGMMPHPERAIAFTHLPNWTLIKEQLKREGKPIPKEGDGMKIFRNAVRYFE